MPWSSGAIAPFTDDAEGSVAGPDERRFAEAPDVERRLLGASMNACSLPGLVRNRTTL